MTFAELNKAVAEAQINTQRLTDLATGTYSPIIVKDRAYLTNASGVKVPVTENSLASLRIVKSKADAIESKSTAEARANDKYSSFQKTAADEKIELKETTKFEVVHQLKILDSITDEPILKNNAYRNYADYQKASRKAFNMPHSNDTETSARNQAFNDATEALRAGGADKAKAADVKNHLMMPVFVIAS
jgi:hypothetical protein